MIAAEKWHEHQENYQKYGLDMKPKGPRKKTKPKKSSITAKDKARLLLLTIFVGILCIGLITATAYAATIKYNINKTIKNNTALEAEIENLQVKIYSNNNIEAIENKATEELGMIYPKTKQIIYLTDKKNAVGDEKQQAYN